MDSVLRPRDIQARIRGGESPEDVAAAAQTSVDRIMGFATPVLAERAYQAELAQKASVRRRAATGPVGHLGQAVEAFLEPHGLGAEDVEWDAWRREDGRWTVLATYLSGAAQQTARFTFDTGGRFVVADNDEARMLVGERTTEAVAEPAAEPDALDTPDAAEPLAPTDADDQLTIGDDTLGLVLGRTSTEPTEPSEPSEPSEPPSLHEPEVTEDLSSVVRAVRPPAPAAGTGDADWMVTQASERPERRPAEPAPATPTGPATPTEPAAPPEPASDAQAPAEPAAPSPAAPSPAAPSPVDRSSRAVEDEPFDEALFEAPGSDADAPSSESSAEEAPRKQAAKSSRGRGRASVPSWDEIMFGTPKD